jgi:hypothetical protein
LIERETMETCDNCGGEGGFYYSWPASWDDPYGGESWEDCPACHGSGWVYGCAPQLDMEEVCDVDGEPERIGEL